MDAPSSPRLASRLLTGQVLVVFVGAVTPVVVASIVGPRLFLQHLTRAGVDDTHILGHAEAAFRSSLGYAITIGTIASLIVAGVVSWLIVRRISAPIEALAAAANRVATGDYDIDAPEAFFSRELEELSLEFADMAHRLGHSDRVRTRMLADLAHEVRTPLATLQAYIDGLEDGVVAADAQAWQTMRTQVTRLRRLADDIREVAAADEHALALDLQEMDGCEAVEAAAHAAGPAFAAKGVTLTMHLCDSACPIMADATRMQQVLGNLLANALRHTRAGGSVTITGGCEQDGFVAAVRDNGEGIPTDQLETVFERFHRVDPARAAADGSGSGLGLTIARGIVSEHGGSLTAASDGPGTGATFTVRLPLR